MKMEQNENGKQSPLGLLQTMTALQPKFNNITLACDDSLTIQTHKVMLMDISTVSGGLLRKHPYPHAYVRGGVLTQFKKKEGIEDSPYENKIINIGQKRRILWDCDKCGKHVRTKDVS